MSVQPRWLEGWAGATAEGRCKPKTCPKCGSEGTMAKQG